MVARIAAAVALAACNGKPRLEEATQTAPVRADAAPAIDAQIAQIAPVLRGGTGDLQIRVEWPDVPAAARSSPGRTPCHTPRAPAVAPTTTWGVPEALVVIDGAAPPLARARLTLADCALTPRMAVGSELAVTSAADRPAKLVLRKRGTLDHLVNGEPLVVQLPIAGHTVTTLLEPGAIYSLETDAAEPEVAFVAAVASGYITEPNGQIIAHDLAVGAHTVTAWLPARAGQPARTGHGIANVAPGDLAELTITLAP